MTAYRSLLARLAALALAALALLSALPARPAYAEVCPLGIFELDPATHIGICQELTAGPTSVAAGAEAEWTVQVRVWNLDYAGGRVITSARINARVPERFDLLSAIATRGSVQIDRGGHRAVSRIIWNKLTLLPGESEVLVVRIKACGGTDPSLWRRGKVVIFQKSVFHMRFSDQSSASVEAEAPITVQVTAP